MKTFTESPDTTTALPPVRSEALLAATIERLAAQFSGYALRLAPNDSATYAILETIDELRRIAANAPRQPQRDSGIGLDAVVGENEPRAKCIHGAWIDEQNCPKCKIMMAELIHREPKNPRKG